MNWILSLSNFSIDKECFYLLPFIKTYTIMEFPTPKGYNSPLHGFEIGIFRFRYTFGIQKLYNDF